MWTCQCGEQIDDQFDACWRCAGAEAGLDVPNDVELPPPECPRCKMRLVYLGMKSFYVVGFLANREHLDLYACSRCGRVEFFLERVGRDLRPQNDMEESGSK